MKHLFAEETISRGARRSKNPTDHFWQCTTCGNVPPLLLPTGGMSDDPVLANDKSGLSRNNASFLAPWMRHCAWHNGNRPTSGLDVNGPMQELQHQTFATFDRARQPKAFDLASQFLHHPNGVLALYGSYGLGKTHLLAALANAYGAAGNCCLFASAVTLFDAIGHV